MSQQHVDVIVEPRDGATLVRVVGVVDGLTMPEVSRSLTDAQRESDPVVVDLSEVTFMDSRGLGALLAANERSREGAASISIYRPSSPVKRLLEVAGLRNVLRETETLPEPAAP